MVTRRRIPARRAAPAGGARSTSRGGARRATPERDAGPGRRRARRRGPSRRWPLLALALLGVLALGAGLWATRAVLTPSNTPPTKVTVSAASPTSVVVDWRADEADTYVVRVSSDRSFRDGSVTLRTTKTRLEVADLKPTTPGGENFVRVDAVRDGKISSSRTMRFELPPERIGTVKLAKVSTTGAKLGWKAVPNARQYDVQIGRDKAFTKGVEAVRTVSSDPGFVTTSLAPDATYFVRVRPVNGQQLGEYGAPVAVRTKARTTEFSIGTWNVCSEKCSGYAGRARVMAAWLNANDLDLFTLQEAGGKRVGGTTRAIFTGGKQGFQMATGGARARYIFYRPALFTQEAGGSFPIGHGRDTTWATFTVKESKRKFMVVDVHLENGHGNDGRRRDNMNAMMSRINAINTEGLPVVYAGDFNSGRHRSADSPGAMMRAAGFTDTVDLAKNPVNRDINTGHTFSTRVLRSGAHVDHIFVSKGFSVLGWKQIARLSGGRYTSPVVSDHNPLKATIALGTPTTSVGDATATTPVPGLAEPTD